MAIVKKRNDDPKKLKTKRATISEDLRDARSRYIRAILMHSASLADQALEMGARQSFHP